jgi:HSF-type DNA-binding
VLIRLFFILLAVDYRLDLTESSPETIPQHLGKGLVSSEVLMSSPLKKECDTTDQIPARSRLNKFVRRLYDMLCGETNSGIVQWRRGLLILLDTKLFAKQILPKYFNTRNFKTFRRQLNYYGFVHVRSYINTGSKSTTALWVNQELATGNIEGQTSCMDVDSVASVLYLKRVEPCDSVKTSEDRRVRKELALSTIEDDLGVSPQTIHLQQLYVLSEEHTKVDSQESFIATTIQRRGTLPYVEHHNWSNMAATAAPVCLLQEAPSMTSRNVQHSDTTSGHGSCRFNSSNSDDSATKPPTSSASVANLLLLLSSG